jgi:D-alanine-D-alanine ligase
VGLNVGLVYDLRTDYLAAGYAPEAVAEFDSEETLSSIEAAIRANGHCVDRIGNGRALCARLVAGGRWDLVFNFAEGLVGRSREAQVPAILELYGIGYTFSDPLVCAATLDKAVAKRLVREAGLATAGFAVVRGPEDAARVTLAFPLFAKPLAEGTGKGIHGRSRIASAADLPAVCGDLLARFAQPVLVEEYLPGREFTVGVLGTGDGARVLGTMEIEVLRQAGSTIYTYDAKEKCESLVRYSNPPHDALRQDVERLALESYRVLECRDAARVDIRCDGAGRPSFLEVNPLPGLHPTHSDLPMIATQEGMKYEALIGEIVAGAARRLGLIHAR